MQFKFFSMPASGCALVEDELNKFLRGHRVLKVDRCFCPDEGGYWTLCVEYMDGESLAPVPPANRRNQKDPTEDLTDEEKLRFKNYRAIRRDISAKNNIKAFLIFTDEELAAIAKLPVLDSSVTSIDGVAPSRIKDYLHFFYTTEPLAQEPDAQESGTPDGADSLF